MAIQIIAKTEVDLKKLLLITSKLLGRSITREFDSRNLIPKSLADYIALLDEFYSPGSDPFNILADCGDLARYVQLTMIAHTTQAIYYDIVMRTDLYLLAPQESPTKGEELFLISGTLDVFRGAVINLCTERTDRGTRQFMNEMLTVLDGAGFGKLFSQYSRCVHKDGTTLLLEHKL